MANISRFDPFSMTRMGSPLDDLFENMMPSYLRQSTGRRGESSCPIDLVERDNAYLLTAEMPGVRKEDINVSITGNQVTIDAEIKEEKQAGEDAKRLHGERWYGKMSRSITLPVEVDEASADAKYEHGVLHLTLPKKASSMAKKLTVH